MTFAVRSAADHASDAELITAVRGGDRTAYAALYERHRAAAYHLARQLVSAPAEAEDLVSDAFAKVFGTLLDGRGPDAAFRAYLLTAVRNTFYDTSRRAKKISYTDDLESHDEGLPFIDTAIAGLDSSMAARAFGRLPERWQIVLWHTEIEGESPAEVAQILGMTPNGVSALAYRAREGLRQAFLQEHIADVGSDDCRLTNDRLGAWARGGLSKREKSQVDRHLEECDRCSAVAAEIADLNSGLRGVVAALAIGGPTLTAAYLTGGSGAKIATLTWAGAGAAPAGFAKVSALLSGAATPVAGAASGGLVGLKGGLGNLLRGGGGNGSLVTVAAAAAAAVVLAAVVVVANTGGEDAKPSANDAGLGVVDKSGQAPGSPTPASPSPVTAGTGSPVTAGTGSVPGPQGGGIFAPSDQVPGPFSGAPQGPVEIVVPPVPPAPTEPAGPPPGTGGGSGSGNNQNPDTEPNPPAEPELPTAPTVPLEPVLAQRADTDGLTTATFAVTNPGTVAYATPTLTIPTFEVAPAVNLAAEVTPEPTTATCAVLMTTPAAPTDPVDPTAPTVVVLAELTGIGCGSIAQTVELPAIDPGVQVDITLTIDANGGAPLGAPVLTFTAAEGLIGEVTVTMPDLVPVEPPAPVDALALSPADPVAVSSPVSATVSFEITNQSEIELVDGTMSVSPYNTDDTQVAQKPQPVDGTCSVLMFDGQGNASAQNVTCGLEYVTFTLPAMSPGEKVSIILNITSPPNIAALPVTLQFAAKGAKPHHVLIKPRNGR